jgi:hypothetical protein
MDQQGNGERYVNESLYVTAIVANIAEKKMPQQWITSGQSLRAVQMSLTTL